MRFVIVLGVDWKMICRRADVWTEVVGQSHAVTTKNCVGCTGINYRRMSRAQFMKEIRMLKEKGKPESGREREASGLLAAMKIQKMWRGFATRKTGNLDIFVDN